MADMFLNQKALAPLTGRRTKSKQIEALRRMGLPFHVNTCGKPVVARVAIEGKRAEAETQKTWKPVARII